MQEAGTRLSKRHTICTVFLHWCRASSEERGLLPGAHSGRFAISAEINGEGHWPWTGLVSAACLGEIREAA
jgi:hypothetical protein